MSTLYVVPLKLKGVYTNGNWITQVQVGFYYQKMAQDVPQNVLVWQWKRWYTEPVELKFNQEMVAMTLAEHRTHSLSSLVTANLTNNLHHLLPHKVNKKKYITRRRADTEQVLALIDYLKD